MGLNAPSDWLVCYDITDKKRLTRVFKLLKVNGVPIQYSVFLVHVTALELGRLEQQISRLIDVNSDDVRAYHLGANNQCTLLGHSLIPDGVLIDCGIASL